MFLVASAQAETGTAVIDRAESIRVSVAIFRGQAPEAVELQALHTLLAEPPTKEILDVFIAKIHDIVTDIRLSNSITQHQSKLLDLLLSGLDEKAGLQHRRALLEAIGDMHDVPSAEFQRDFVPRIRNALALMSSRIVPLIALSRRERAVPAEVCSIPLAR